MGRVPGRHLLPLALGFGWLVVTGSARAAAEREAAPGEAEAAPRETHRLRAEVGLEYDTNPQRTELAPGGVNLPRTPSFLGRGVLSWTTSSRLGDNHSLDLAAALAAKHFLREAATSEDVLLVDESAHWSWRTTSATVVGASAVYSEALQHHERDFQDRPASAPLPEPRDYRAVSGAARASYLTGGGLRLTAALGARVFLYKPIPDASFRAPTLGLEARYHRESEESEVEWDLTTGVNVEDRHFDGYRQIACGAVSGCVSKQDPGTFQRDLFGQAFVDLTRTGAVLLGVRYVFQLNESNAYQNSVQRHFVSARVALPLPWDFYLSARGELVWARYADPINLTIDDAGRPYATFEDENRSQARVELSRTLPHGVELSLRWSAYASALGSVGDYHRQTVLLATAWQWE